MTPRVIMHALIAAACVWYVASASAIAPPCPHPCECFVAANGIQVANCTDLPADRMTIVWPQKTLRIRFENRGHASPVVFKNMAFKRFPRLTYLDVAGGPIRYVGNAAFDGLPELLELDLIGTGIRKLHRDTFAGNQNLAFLSLKKNPELYIGPSFLVSQSITELDLSECALKTLKSVYFKSLPNLKYLFAARNELKVLGSQFGPAGLKYVDLGHNRIEYVYEDLEAYKRLKTVDLTGNPVNCTCELTEVDRRLASRGVAFGNTVKCKNTGKPLGDMIETCSAKEMMGDGPADMYQEENLLEIDQNSLRSTEDLVDDGSGSGDDELLVSSDQKPLTVTADKIDTLKNNTITDRPDSSGTSVTEMVVNASSETPVTETVVKALSEASVTETVVNASSETPVTETMVNASSEAPVTETVVNAASGAPVTETVVNTSSGAPVIETVFNGSSRVPVTETVANRSSTFETAAVPPGAREDASDGVVGTQPSQVVPTASSSDGNSSGNIESKKIQAPEDEQTDDVRSRVTDYLKSNVGVTATAVLLAVVLVAIVYKAVCAGRSQSHNIGADAKEVELKEIKYVAANTEDEDRGGNDSPTTGDGSAADDHLLDDDRDSDDDEDSDRPPRSSPVQNGLLDAVVDAVNAARRPQTPSPNGSPDVPTRVIVKLTETPKASKPITVNNVH